jgi:hypothetical protein
MIAYWRMKISLTCSSVSVIAWSVGEVADAAPGAALCAALCVALFAALSLVGSVAAYVLGILDMA